MLRQSPVRARLRKDLRRSIRSGHPWLYEEAFDSLDTQPGAVVDVIDKEGKWAGRGIRDVGPIGVRIFTLDPQEEIDARFFERRIERAIELRNRLAFEKSQTSGYRMVHGEGDMLPGIVCDRYDAHAVIRLDGDFLDGWTDILRDAFSNALQRIGIQTILLRQGRREHKRSRAWSGAIPDAPCAFEEYGMKLLVDLVEGQKTGAFLDHRESRLLVRRIASGSRVLNLYGYTGGFSIAAGLGGAIEVHTVDIAPGALALAQTAWVRNGLAAEAHTTFCQDVFTFADNARERRLQYDFVIADPPNFAPNQASLDQALKSYEKLHRKALDLLNPGGFYFAGSCSSHVNMEAFLQTLRSASKRNDVALQQLDVRHAPPDHPRLPAFSEGDYLKAVLCRRLA